jgi:hypothetical protein
MMYHLKLQPSEIDALEYYEYHYFIKDMSDVLKKQKEGQDNEQQNANEQYGKNSLGSIKTPKVNMPKMSMPSMPKL